MKFWWFGCHERVIHQGNTFWYSWLSAQPSNSFMRRESNRLCHTYGRNYEFPMIHERHISITLTMQLWNWIVLWLMNGEFNVCSPFSWREIFAFIYEKTLLLQCFWKHMHKFKSKWSTHLWNQIVQWSSLTLLQFSIFLHFQCWRCIDLDQDASR